MFISNETIFIIFLISLIIIANICNINKREPFSNLFNQDLYYPDVDCLQDKSCIIKPNNDSYYDYNINCKKNKLLKDKYYHNVNNKNKIIETFDGRGYYDRENKIYYKTNSPGQISKNTECSYGFIKNKDGYCEQITN